MKKKTMKEFWDGCGAWTAELKVVDKFIRDATGYKPVVMGGMGKSLMLGYKMGRYKGSGKEGDWPLISLAPQKNYMSIYACAVIDGTYINDKYKDDLGKVDCGKSCIKFKSFDDINHKTLTKLLKESMKQKNPFAYEG